MLIVFDEALDISGLIFCIIGAGSISREFYRVVESIKFFIVSPNMETMGDKAPVMLLCQTKIRSALHREAPFDRRVRRLVIAEDSDLLATMLAAIMKADTFFEHHRMAAIKPPALAAGRL